MLNADDVQVTHFLPGRIRLKMPTLRGNPAEAEALAHALRTLPGFKSMEISTLTGSVLIRYDPGSLATKDGSRRLRVVLQEYLPGLDADQVVKWLGHA